MKNKLITSFSILYIFLCINSMIYYQPQITPSDSIDNKLTDLNLDEPQNPYDDNLDYQDESEDLLPIKKIETPGDYQLKGYFFHSDYLDIDADGLGWELREYDVMKDDGANSLEIRPRFDSTGSSEREHTWPLDTVNFYEFTSPYSPYSKSHFFTPVFNEETYLTGKVHFILHITNQWSGTVPVIDLKISVFEHNPRQQSNSLLFTVEDFGINTEFYSGSPREYSHTIPDKYTINAGNRVKIKYEGRISNLSADGEFKIYCCDLDIGGTYTWDIIDGSYSKTYTISDIDDVLGVQFYMNNDYPRIQISGFDNETRYFEGDKEIYMGTSGAENSSFRWNSNPYTSFSGVTMTNSPTTFGWHYLYIQAIDDYGNNRTVVYQIGYDTSLENVNLLSHTNNTLIGDTAILEFNISDVDSATFEWDGGTQYSLESPYELNVTDLSGIHNLIIQTTDVFESLDFLYIFTIDNDAPTIELLNVVNETTYPAGKRVDVNITDISPNIDVFYNWDSVFNFSWTPTGDTYSVTLPESDGAHWLNIYANDTYGHFTVSRYFFIVDSSAFYVELRNMENESYYFGGNTIEVTISGSNGSVYFFWDNNAETNGSDYLVASIFTLSGGNALSTDLDVHILTLIVVDLFLTNHTYVYEFTIDQEPP
ncbi:MAG: hypothetical protein KAS47_00330, partial [Candidatus Heimdallarchaeota archaeon]|nr:hypothetical protein [Candidatus Heimdallarchaeota archaeon]